jgi:hypothetical protein
VNLIVHLPLTQKLTVRGGIQNGLKSANLKHAPLFKVASQFAELHCSVVELRTEYGGSDSEQVFFFVCKFHE